MSTYQDDASLQTDTMLTWCRRKSWCLVLAIFFSSQPLLAVPTTTFLGRLEHKVKDTLFPIPGIRVTLTDGSRTYGDAYSGFDGGFSIPKVPTQDYLLQVWFSGKAATSFVVHGRSQQYTDIGSLTPDDDRLNDRLEPEILRILRTLHTDVFIQEQISERRAANSRASTFAPPSEPLLALIDATFFGTAEDCILFTQRGIYYYTHVVYDPTAPQRDFIRYEDFPAHDFRKVRPGVISFNKHQTFKTSTLGLRDDDLINSLRAIQRLVQEFKSSAFSK
jgi:hypothetical protein